MLLSIGLILGVLFYVLLLITHVLILIRKIPYQLVNGGRNKSYEQQKKISILSIIIAILGLMFLSFYWVLPTVVHHSIYLILLSIMTLYWLLGVILQFMGTHFEKYAMSIIAIIGFSGHLLYLIALIIS